MHDQAELRRFLRGEVEDCEAYSKLCKFLTFDQHPASRIAKNLSEVYSQLSAEQLEWLASYGHKKERRFFDKLSKVITGKRNTYRRSRGCAHRIIDVVAETAGIRPAQIIYGSDSLSTDQLVGCFMDYLRDAPAGLTHEEVRIVTDRVAALHQLLSDITASLLVRLTQGTSLSTFTFMTDTNEGIAYKQHRSSMIEIFRAICEVYFGGELHDDMHRLAHDFKLLKLEDNAPDSFINEFCMKFRQQLLDGNTDFSQHRLVSLKAYLTRAYANFLIGKKRVLQTRLKHRPVLQTELVEDGDTWEPPEDTAVKRESMVSGQDLLLEAILRIPNDVDRQTLRITLVEVLSDSSHEEEIDNREAKQALLNWASYILDDLGADTQKLASVVRKRLIWYAEGRTAIFLRDLIKCERLARDCGHDREWLARCLQERPAKVRRWIRCEQIPEDKAVKVVGKRLSNVLATLMV